MSEYEATVRKVHHFLRRALKLLDEANSEDKGLIARKKESYAMACVRNAAEFEAKARQIKAADSGKSNRVAHIVPGSSVREARERLVVRLVQAADDLTQEDR